MKYTYAYKTSDGKRHEAAIDAASREAVFQALRQQGIKAIKVVAADGSKANGEVRGVRKRTVAAIVGLVAASVGMASWLAGSRSGTPTDATERVPPTFETSQTRRQVIGDAAVIEKGIRTGWADVFSGEGERFLASFAIPGVPAGVRSTTEDALHAAITNPAPALSRGATVGGNNCRTPGSPSPVRPPCSFEALQIIAMVEGMKAEARAYLAAGGTVAGYAKRLTERQDAEIAVHERAKERLDAAKKTKSGDELTACWEELNDQLRNLGICPLSLE